MFLFIMCATSAVAAFARAAEFKTAAHALNKATSSTSGGANWVLSAIAGKRDTNMLLEKAFQLLDAMLTASISEDAQRTVSRVVRGFTAAELSGPAEEVGRI